MINGLLDTFSSFRIILLQISRHYGQRLGANFLQHTKDNNSGFIASRLKSYPLILPCAPPQNITQHKINRLFFWQAGTKSTSMEQYILIFGILPNKHSE